MSTQRQTPILFISGSGLPSWIWDDVQRHLSVDWETKTAPRPNELADLRTYAQTALDAAPSERFIVVAHSIGAVVALKMHELAPARLSGFLAVAGVIPLSGKSFLSAMPMPNRAILSLAIRVVGTRPPEKTIRHGLCSDLDDELGDRIVADFRPESRSLFQDPIGGDTYPPNSGYVRTSLDRELPAKLQTQFVNNLNPRWTRTVSSGHLPMLAKPKALAKAIDDFGQR